MKVAILGGGITGLTASYCLSEKGHDVSLFEKEPILGGLASGFRQDRWEWPLERAYHHLFASDDDIRIFAKEIGFDEIMFSIPKTDSLYANESGHTIYPVDSPLDFLRFPLLSPVEKIRASAVLGFLKLSPFLSLYENISAQLFIQKYMGEGMWNTFFSQLFRKKFGKYAGNIVASFIWARIKKRTQKLGYIRGGFQTFIDFLESENKKKGVTINSGIGVDGVVMEGGKFTINKQKFDVVISTLPTPVMGKVTSTVFDEAYLNRFSKLNYLHAVNLIIESKTPLLEKSYWLNVCAKEFPFMVLVQHTNFVDKKHYGGNHILYIGNYVERDDKLVTMDADQLLVHFMPHLNKLTAGFEKHVVNHFAFRGPFAQPIFDRDFIKNKPEFTTPVKNFFIANLDMTYPYDRGTNYAVKLGREVANLL